MTRAEFIARAQAKYNEETGDAISSTFLQGAANDVQREVAIETCCYPVSTTMSFVASQRTYILPATWFAIRRDGVQTSVYAPLPGPIPIEAIMRADKSWLTATGTPEMWYESNVYVTASSVTNWGIGFYKVPSANATNEVTLSGFATPADFSGDSISPPWPTPYHDVMVWGLCLWAAERDMGMEAPNAKAISYFRQGYEAKKAQLKAASTQFGARVYTRGGRADETVVSSGVISPFRVNVTA